MPETKILIVDDDKHICELINLYLVKEGYRTKTAYSAEEALSIFSSFLPDAVILDVMLPGKDGFACLTELRRLSKAPVIMLTAKGDTFDKVLGLELGADDYIVKPFDPKEFLARVKAVLRRYRETGQEEDVIEFPGIKINLKQYSVNYHGKSLDLPPKEFEVLAFLAKHPNQVFTRDQLLDNIWGYAYAGDTRTVDVHIKRIREKFDQDDSFAIKTIRGIGYKLEVK